MIFRRLGRNGEAGNEEDRHSGGLLFLSQLLVKENNSLHLQCGARTTLWERAVLFLYIPLQNDFLLLDTDDFLEA